MKYFFMKVKVNRQIKQRNSVPSSVKKRGGPKCH